MAHARRKFFELHATNKSHIAEQALRYIQLLYEIESEVRDLEPDLRCRIRQEKAAPVMDRLHVWMIAQRSEEHTSELQSLMRKSYAVFCLKNKITEHQTNQNK